MPMAVSVRALRRWLIFVALLRLVSGSDLQRAVVLRLQRSASDLPGDFAKQCISDSLRTNAFRPTYSINSPQKVSILVIVSCPALLAQPSKQARLHAVTRLYGRTFATWTSVTCALSLACAANPRVAGVYGELARHRSIAG